MLQLLSLVVVPAVMQQRFLAADEGLDVTIVEAEPRLGGTCLLRGCIPEQGAAARCQGHQRS